MGWGYEPMSWVDWDAEREGGTVARREFDVLGCLVSLLLLGFLAWSIGLSIVLALGH